MEVVKVILLAPNSQGEYNLDTWKLIPKDPRFPDEWMTIGYAVKQDKTFAYIPNPAAKKDGWFSFTRRTMAELKQELLAVREDLQFLHQLAQEVK